MGALGDVRTGGERNLLLGRCAGWLFLAGAVASAPANQLLSRPDPGWYMHLIDLLAFVSGVVCLLIPWDRIDPRAIHLIPLVATGEIVLTVTALGVHGDVYLWFFVLGAVFNGYAFRRRGHVALHMGVAGAGFVSTAIYASGWDGDALVRALVGVPTLALAAAVVTWLREGLEARERHLLALARTDALTGLGNRRALMEELEAAVAPGAAPRRLALFDLDGFKAYNDRHGHPAGDALLERAGARLRAVVGRQGAAYRLGGDEFCVLVDLGGHGADAVLESCAGVLADSLGGVSHGIVDLPGDVGSASAALSLADRRMYEVKAGRRAERGAEFPIVATLAPDRRTGSRSTAPASRTARSPSRRPGR